MSVVIKLSFFNWLIILFLFTMFKSYAIFFVVSFSNTLALRHHQLAQHFDMCIELCCLCTHYFKSQHHAFSNPLQVFGIAQPDQLFLGLRHVRCNRQSTTQVLKRISFGDKESSCEHKIVEKSCYHISKYLEISIGLLSNFSLDMCMTYYLLHLFVRFCTFVKGQGFRVWNRVCEIMIKIYHYAVHIHNCSIYI